MLANAETISTLVADYGMQASLGPGKTEAVIVLRGRRVATAQARLCFDAPKVGHLPPSGGGELRVVVSYRHLVLSTSDRDQGGIEIAHRVAAATAARHALGTTILPEISSLSASA